MKVLHVFNEIKASGAEVMFCSSAPYWTDEGVIIEILSTGETVGPFAPKMVTAGYKVHHLPFGKSIKFFLAFYCLLRDQHYDVVHVHCERASFYYALVARMAGARLIRTIHATFAFNGFLRFKRSVQRLLTRMIGGVHVSVSPSVAKTEMERFNNNTIQIANWYDNSRFVPPRGKQRRHARKSFGINDSLFVIVTVGNCCDVKNHVEILKALAKVRHKLDFVYLHIGEEEVEHPERKLAKELNIYDRIQFLGFTSDVLPALYAADLFVMPSLREGFGIAALEAMGTGIPVLLADVPGLKDFNLIKGIFWAGTDAESLASKILSVVEIPFEDRCCRGKRTQEIVMSKYSIKCGVSAYVDLYRGKTVSEFK